MYLVAFLHFRSLFHLILFNQNFTVSNIKNAMSQAWWHTFVISATQEAEAGGSQV
jgi:hypothetical protein